ncbi:hypothetical protein CK203_108120 [Vitis vinifera]|uniref:Uncharacterized protein n=1 Tax=Vitis vinifera TaxID=29760 RepID=A0A438DK49_VITVI|nr:hypothetical protein CK203_108120 [Vitis vinifera]
MVQRRGTLLEDCSGYPRDFLWPSSSHYGRSFCTLKRRPGAPVGPEASRDSTSRASRGATAVEIPADMRAPAPAVPSTGPMPEVASSAPPATPGTPPVITIYIRPPPSSESRIAISISESRLSHQTQHTAILRQIQHLGIPIPFRAYRSITGPSSRKSNYAPEEPTTGEIEASIEHSDLYQAIIST